MSNIDHPKHYGGKDNPFEPIKIIEGLNLDFHLGNALKYILRAGKKTEDAEEDLQKAIWYLNRKIENLPNTKEKTNREKFLEGVPFLFGKEDDIHFRYSRREIPAIETNFKYKIIKMTDEFVVINSLNGKYYFNDLIFQE